MQSKTTVTKLAQIPGALWKHARSYNQIFLLTNMIYWNILINGLKPLLSIQRLILVVGPRKPRRNILPQDVLRYMQWFDYFNLFRNNGDCIVQALMLHRFLFIAGEKADLLIGLRGNQGHAWVEISGNAIREPMDTQIKYHPIMVLKAGSRILMPFLLN